jgi:hypothetical protein
MDEEEDICPICLESSVDIFTPCSHGFCCFCLSQVFIVSDNCPLCRQNILELLMIMRDEDSSDEEDEDEEDD